MKAIRMTDAAYIALGSNLGDRETTLREALRLLDARDDVSVRHVSSFIETVPQGGPAEQGPYINAAAELETSLGPHELLAALQQTEAALGRDRAGEQRWGPRTCDLDILLMGEAVIDETDLTIHHPRMCERAFVLIPLAEIAPDAIHPVLAAPISRLLTGLEGGT